MKTLNITETRKQLSQIINNELSVQIGVSKHQSVILPKSTFDAIQDKIETLKKEKKEIEIELIMIESEKRLKSSQKRFTGEEVDAMLAKVWSKHEKDRVDTRSVSGN